MRKFFPVEELARDERFHKISMRDRMADPRTAMNLSGDQSRRSSNRLTPDRKDASDGARSLMHGIFVGEIQALEGAGRTCWDFTTDEAPFALKLDMARQCWDEARHVEIYSALLGHLDGDIGEFPENLFLFEFGCSNDPAERVTGVNRCLEGLALDVFGDTIRFGKKADDDTIWRSVDYVAADEVTHVRFGQVWSKALTENDPDRRKRVVAFQRKVDRAFSFGGLRGVYDDANESAFLPIAVELRKLAGFSDADIEDVVAAGPTVSA